MNDSTNKVYVAYYGIGYEVSYKWFHCEFIITGITPKVTDAELRNIIKTKAIDKAIEAEYDAWVADHELDSLDETFDEGWTLLGHHNTGSGAKKFLDNH
jgi:hypothetical protein